MNAPMNRRQALAGAGAVAGALAITGPALASGESDAELRALWREYINAFTADTTARKAEADAYDMASGEAFPKCRKVDALQAEAEAKHKSQRIPARVQVDGYNLDKSQLDVTGNLVAIMYAPAQESHTSEWARKETQRIHAAARRKYKVASFKPQVDKAMAAVEDAEQAIMDAEAHGIEGITIKLALSMVLDSTQMCRGMCGNDKGAAATAYRALCDLTGTDLAAEASRIENEIWA